MKWNMQKLLLQCSAHCKFSIDRRLPDFLLLSTFRIYLSIGIAIEVTTCYVDKRTIIGYEFLHRIFCLFVFPSSIPLLWLTWFSEMSFLIKVLCGLQFCKLKWIEISFLREFHDTLSPLLEIIGDTLGFHRPGLRNHDSMCCLTCAFMRTKLTAAVH